MAKHKDLTSIHLGAYVDSVDPGAVGAGKLWVDTSSGPPYAVKVRDLADAAWEDIASGGGGGGTVTAVTATSPLASSGGTTPDISLTGTVPIARIPTGSTGSTVPFGNDARFADARTPTGSAGGDLTGTYPNPTLVTTAVTPGSYTNTNLTVDGKGRVTAASNGSGGGMTNPMTTSQDIIVGGSSGTPGRLAKGANGTFLGVNGSGNLAYSTPSGGGGIPSHAYYAVLAAMLEPDALEAPQINAFSYAIGSGVTKYLLLGWALQIGAAGRLETRDPRIPLPLRNVTVAGMGSYSVGIFLDPTLPTYTDAWTTYHDRLLALTTLPTKYLAAGQPTTTTGAVVPFLPGPYGSIILQATVFNMAWLALNQGWNNGAGALPLDYELGDATTDWVRYAHNMTVPITKYLTNGLQSGLAGGAGTAAGSITYVNLPSSWGVVSDPLAPYDFRDDFMGTALDTSTVWTRTQSTAGNVEIVALYNWCKCLGSGTWGTDGAYSQWSLSRTVGKKVIADVYVGGSGSLSPVIIGWHDGGGHGFANFVHGVYFSSGQIYVFENGTSRGTVGSGYTTGYIYRVRITLTSGGAGYEIQGGGYGLLGSASWTTITPGTTSSSTTTLHVGFSSPSTDIAYVGDIRVY